MPVKSSGTLLFYIGLLLSLVACSAPEAGSALQPEQPAGQTPIAAISTQPVAQPTPQISKPSIEATATALPAATNTPEISAASGCSSERGQFEHGNLSSQLLPEPLEFRVYLPPCYEQLSRQRYPVLYLVHGQSFNHDQWDRLGAGEIAGRLIAAGEIAPFLIVLPRDRSWAQPDEDMFGQALIQELIPYVDSTYRTQPLRAYRAIGGLSRGAAWAVHLGLTQWAEFGAIGAHSLPVFFSDAPKIRKWLDAIPGESRPRIYLDIGDKDRPEILESARWFENLLTEKSIPHEWHLFSGYHEESYWQAHLEQYLRWYASEW